MANLVKRGTFAARIQGLGRSGVYRHCEPGGDLYPALVEGLVDIDHPIAREFMGRHSYHDPDAPAPQRQLAKRPAPAAKRPAPAYTPPSDDEAPEEDDSDSVPTAEWLEMPLREVIERFGTGAKFKDYVGAKYKIIQIMGMEEEQARKRGDYVHRVHVERLVAMIDGLAKALLSDAATNMVNTMTNMVKAGAARQDTERAVREVISRTIKGVKSQAERALRDV